MKRKECGVRGEEATARSTVLNCPSAMHSAGCNRSLSTCHAAASAAAARTEVEVATCCVRCVCGSFTASRLRLRAADVVEGI